MSTIKKDLIIEKVDRFLRGETSMTETMEVLDAIATDPKLEEYLVTERRLDYVRNQMEEYGSFIPIRSMAADDGKNLCDFQCESYILRSKGIKTEEGVLSERARRNYWLRGEGTPLYNMGKLLESEGMLVNRCTDATIQKLVEALKEYMVIAVVNGDSLSGNGVDILDENFSLENEPNHAVVVINIDQAADKITLYNPAAGNEEKEYGLSAFENAFHAPLSCNSSIPPMRFRKHLNHIPSPRSQLPDYKA